MIQVLTFVFAAIHVSRGLRIGIVGGGPSGLYVSRLLREQRGEDMDDIVIFEKSAEIAPMIVTHGIDLDGNGIPEKAMDITANFIPTRSYVPFDPNQFNGVYGKLQSLFDEVSTEFDINTTLTFETSAFFDIVDKVPEFNPILARFDGATEIVPQFVIALGLLYSVTAYTTSTQGVYQAGFCLQGETIQEWGQRTGLPVISESLAVFSSHVAAEYTNMDEHGLKHSCAYIFRRSSLLAMEAFRLPLIELGLSGPVGEATVDSVFSFPGVSENFGPLAEDVKTFIKAALNAPHSGGTAKNFHFGYRIIWEHIAELEKMNGVNVRLGTEVTGIESKRNGRVKLTGTKRWINKNGKQKEKDITQNFDAVFFTVRPIDAVEIFDDCEGFEEVFGLYDQVKNDCGSFSVAVFNSDQFNDFFVGSTEEDAVFAMGSEYSLDAVGTDEYKNILENQCFPHAFYHDFPDLPYFAPNAFSAREIDEDGTIQFVAMEECLELMVDWLNTAYGMDVSSDDVVLQAQADYYPYVVSPENEADGWFENFEALQGKENVFYFGEVFSGQSMPTIVRYLEQNIPNSVQMLNDLDAVYGAAMNYQNEAVDGEREGYWTIQIKQEVGIVLVVLLGAAVLVLLGFAILRKKMNGNKNMMERQQKIAVCDDEQMEDTRL